MKTPAMTCLPKSAARAQNGFVLVAVLWILAALATLATIYSSYTVNTAGASRVADDRVQAEASIRAGVEMAVFRQLAAPEKARPARGGFDMRVGRTAVSVRFRSEGARIDLNAAAPDLLAGLFTAVGVDSSQAETFADRIVGWRTKSTAGADAKAGAAAQTPADDKGGAAAQTLADDKDDKAAKEDKLYSEQHMPYPPRHAPFDNALELSLLPGILACGGRAGFAVCDRVQRPCGRQRVQRGPDGPIRSPENDASNSWRGTERAGQRSWRWARAVGAARSSEVERHGRGVESIPGLNRGRLRQRQACSCRGRVSPQGPRRRPRR